MIKMLFFGEAENVLDFLPIFAIMALMPILIVVSPVMALNQLTVYRVQHFDLHNSRFGSRNSVMNLESITVSQIKESFARKCILFTISELIDNLDTFQNIIDETLAAGILIIIPNTMRSLNAQQLDRFLAFEKSLMNREIQIPIYLTYESKQLLDIYENQSIKLDNNSDNQFNKSNVEKLFDSVVANGYQMVVSGPQTSAVKDLIITNIQGKLIGAGVEDQMPTIAFVTHYDAFSIAPGLSFGADSNGSGVVALLELIRLFSKLYSNVKTQPKVNLLFLLSGAGKFNYIGTKKWIEDHLDSAESSLLTESLFTACLDSLADSEHNNALFMHVSKPPKEGSAAALFFNDLKQIASNSLSDSMNVSMIHKKINLADETLAWEHERFSIRRLSAFTLSSISSPKSLHRKSTIDVFDDQLLEPLYNNINLICEAIARQLYGDIRMSLFASQLQVSKPFIKSLLSQISKRSRAQQLLLSSQRGTQVEVSPFLATLEHIMKRYANDVELFHVKVDTKEPELVFYEPSEAIMNVYNVKPAIFDLFLSIGIAAYLGIFYLLLSNFHHISSLAKKIVNSNDSSRIKMQ